VSQTTAAAAAGTVTLGDRTVNRMGFGAMRITGQGIWGDPPDPEAAKVLLRRVVDLGVNLIDTADSYGPEVSERLLAEALHPYPEDLVIATKGGLLRPGPGRWDPDCRPDYLRGACEASLRRLRVEAIDVYQLHTVDPDVPFEESVGEFARLREEGKVRHIGLSNVEASHIERARAIVPVVSVQNRYSVADRESESVLEACERDGLVFLPWFPLVAGDLAEPGGVLAGVAKEHDATAAQIALAWLLHRSDVIAPIPGTSSVEHLEENVAAASIELSAEEMAAIEDAASAYAG
jgi:aryl-alcohol dehydrogenase-like predicted oxidoreductase